MADRPARRGRLVSGLRLRRDGCPPGLRPIAPPLWDGRRSPAWCGVRPPM